MFELYICIKLLKQGKLLQNKQGSGSQGTGLETTERKHLVQNQQMFSNWSSNCSPQKETKRILKSIQFYSL